MDLGWTAAVAEVATQLFRRPAPQPPQQDALQPPATEAATSVPWTWAAYHLLALLRQYPAGVTLAMATAELERLWTDKRQHAERHGLRRLATYIDAVLREARISADAYLEVTVAELRNLGAAAAAGPAGPAGPATNPGGTRLAVLTDTTSERKLDAYLHGKLARAAEAALACGAPCRLRMTGCRLSDLPGARHASRLLPTPLALVLLDANAADPLPSWVLARFPPGQTAVRAVRRQIAAATAADTPPPPASLPPLALWATIVSIDDPFVVAAPGGDRRRVRGIWLRCTSAATTSDDVDDGAVADAILDKACLRLWDEQLGLADLVKPVRRLRRARTGQQSTRVLMGGSPRMAVAIGRATCSGSTRRTCPCSRRTPSHS